MARLSIITVNKNDAEGLKRTLQSIWEKQTFRDIEHIVIDGASTDNSINVIKEYESKLTYWISEPDTGIYNAMNKGIVQAKGDYLIFLNSGDWFENDILTKVFNTHFKEDIVYGDFYYYHNADKIIQKNHPDKLTAYFLFYGSLGHPSTFIKRELFENSQYEEKYRIISDWTFFVQHIILNSCTTKHLNFAISYFNTYGISSNPKNTKITLQEQADFFQNGFPNLITGFIKEFEALKKDLETQKWALDIMSKHRTQRLLDSRWVQRKARHYIKLLFLLQKLLRK